MDFYETYKEASELAVYLTLDHWRDDHVAELLAGINPAENNQYISDGPPLNGCTIFPLRYLKEPYPVGQYIQRKVHIERIWNLSVKPEPVGTKGTGGGFFGTDQTPVYPVKVILKWAAEKGIFIEWEEWAKSNGYAYLFDFSDVASPTGAQDEAEKPLAGKTRNTMLRTIYALCVAVNNNPSGNKTKDAASILAAIKAAGIEHPITDKQLGNYMAEGKELTAQKLKQDLDKRK